MLESQLLKKPHYISKLFFIGLMGHILTDLISLAVLSNHLTLAIAALMIIPVTLITLMGLVAISLAYIYRNQMKNSWLGSHYQYLIRTFWLGVLYSVIAGLIEHTTLNKPVIIHHQLAQPVYQNGIYLIGFAFALIAAFWLTRLLKHRRLLAQHHPIPNPKTWLI